MKYTIDLSKLKETDLKNFTLKKTICVIKVLEQAILSNSELSEYIPYNSTDAMELFSDYYSFLTIIYNKLTYEDFPNFDKKKIPNWQVYKDILSTKVLALMNSIQNAKYSFSVNNQIDHINLKAKNALQEVEKKFEIQKDEIAKNTTKTIRELEEVEGKMLSHVLSLMGIFTAVTTIIMSAIITSSTWLNNATGASAIIAFSVPNLVTLIAVISLMLLIFFTIERYTLRLIKLKRIRN